MVMPTDLAFSRGNGHVVFQPFTLDEVSGLLDFYDRDRTNFSYCWRSYGKFQTANYDALVSTPAFDVLVRHPKILEAVQSLMGGQSVLGRSVRGTWCPIEGEESRDWHRDRPHWLDHPLRMDYLQMMLYLTDVEKNSHCFSISPESIEDPILDEAKAQLNRNGCSDIHGPTGTVCLFNISALHTANHSGAQIRANLLWASRPEVSC